MSSVLIVGAPLSSVYARQSACATDNPANAKTVANPIANPIANPTLRPVTNHSFNDSCTVTTAHPFNMTNLIQATVRRQHEITLATDLIPD